MKKRITSVLLVLALCLTLLPTAALAADSNHTVADHDNTSKFTKLWMKDGNTLMKGNSDWTTTTVDGNKCLVLDESDGDSYYLDNDLTLTGYSILISGNVTLCLNGKNIVCNDKTKDGHVISVGADKTTAHLTLTDCQTTAGRIDGGGNVSPVVNLYGGCGLDMYGGTITGGGVGVYVDVGCTFKMSGGAISGNSGHGVYIVAGTFNMYDGCSISANSGRGVFVGTNSKFNMNGGEITGNNGGVEVYNDNNASLTVSGAARITGNTVNDKPNNVYLQQGKDFTAENLTEGAEIGVTTEKAPTRSAPITVAGVVQDFSAYIKSDQVGYTVKYIGDSNFDGMVLTIDEHKHYLCGKTTCNGGDGHSTDKIDFIPWTDALANQQAKGKTASNSLPSKPGNYYLVDNVTLTETWEPETGTVLCLNGHSITANGSFDAITVNSGITFTLTDCKGGKSAYGQITHGRNNETNSKYTGRGVYVGDGTFNMYGGSITDNTATKGGGVYVTSGGTFNMTGGTIGGTKDGEANKANYGGGVYMDYGTFNMYGGSITDNTANNGQGGGVYVNGTGKFYLYGGAKISGNKADNGGGVRVYNGTFAMSGGSISNNTATQNGGGVYVDSGKFTVSGNVNITSNMAGRSSSKVTNNVYLKHDWTIITIGGTLDEGASIGVTKNPAENRDIATGATGVTLSENIANKFKSDVEGYEVRLSDKALVLAVDSSGGTTNPPTHTHYLCGGGSCNTPQGVTHPNCKNKTEFTKIETLDELKAAAKNGGNYYLSDSFTLDKTLEIKKDMTLCLNGQTITGADVQTTINVSTGKTFVLTDCKSGGMLKYNGEKNSQHTGVAVNGGSFTMYHGTVDGFTDGVRASSKIVMYGGSIVNSEDCGVYSSGTFEMYGGSITENGRGSYNGLTGCGVYMYGTMTVGGNAIIRNNTNGSGNAQNVYWRGYNENNPPIPITVKDSFTGSFGVTAFNWPSPGKQMQLTSGGGEITDITKKITSDKDIYVVDVNGNDLVLKVKGTTEKIPVDSITLNTTAATLEVGKTTTLTATVTPENAANKKVIWTSFNENVATVTANGTVKALAVGTTTITATAESDPSKSAICTVTVTGGATPSQPGGGTGGSSSSGGSSGGSSGSSSSGGSSSDRDGYDSNPVIKTETKNHPDGSTTKTETRKDGTVTATTTGKDGSTSKTETKKDGSSVTENKAADGSTGTVKTDKNGQTEASAKVSAKAVEAAKKSGEAVKAPVEVEASRNSGAAPTVKVELPQNSGKTEVEIPVSNAKPSTVAVLVHADGTEEIVKNSLPTEDGIQLTINGGATVKIVDNSKGFIDTQDHWAKDAIDFVSARELVNGMNDSIYAPNNSTTRAQLWTILARQNDADLNGGNTWYEKAQLWSKDKGISDGTQPDAAINRAQMVTMLWRTMGQPAAGGAANFNDVPANSYYAQAVAWAVENGITAGVGGGRFDPNSTCTRAQIATFLYRYMK